MKTAEEILAAVKNLENAERWKLLEKMHDTYYNPSNKSSELQIEILNEISKIKKDIVFLSGTVGLHDMYFNRIEKEKVNEER